MSEELIDHYERLSCGHQNNLLIIQSDGKKSKPGECPKGCQNITVLKVKQIAVRLAEPEEPEEP